MIMITPAEFEDEMERLTHVIDPEVRLSKMLSLMCEALIDNGYETGVNTFNASLSKK